VPPLESRSKTPQHYYFVNYILTPSISCSSMSPVSSSLDHPYTKSQYWVGRHIMRDYNIYSCPFPRWSPPKMMSPKRERRDILSSHYRDSVLASTDPPLLPHPAVHKSLSKGPEIQGSHHPRKPISVDHLRSQGERDDKKYGHTCLSLDKSPPARFRPPLSCSSGCHEKKRKSKTLQQQAPLTKRRRYEHDLLESTGL